MPNKLDKLEFFIAISAIMDTDHVDIFISVARAGNFAVVARERGTAPSSISRAVQSLEDALGVRLLERTTRAVALTEAGQRFLDGAAPAVEELDAARDAARKLRANSAGHLKIAASVSFGNTVLARQMRAFNDLYPDITVELLLSDEVIDLVRGGFDIAIRHGSLPDSSLIASRLRTVLYFAVASESYLGSAPSLTKPQDLRNHRTLNFNYPAFRRGWRFSKGDKVVDVETTPGLTSSNAEALKTCAINGMGVALLADWIVEDDIKSDRLKRILARWSVRGIGAEENTSIWLVRPSRAFVPEKVRVFENFLRNKLSN